MQENKMTQRFASKLSDQQMQFARKVESAGLASVSQAVKAIERGEVATIRDWQKALAAKES
jgi:hypothetical protein